MRREAADDRADEPGDDEREAHPRARVARHRGAIFLGPRAREHREEDEAHREDELVGQEREELRAAVSADELVGGLGFEPGGLGRESGEPAEQAEIRDHQEVERDLPAEERRKVSEVCAGRLAAFAALAEAGAERSDGHDRERPR